MGNQPLFAFCQLCFVTAALDSTVRERSPGVACEHDTVIRKHRGRRASFEQVLHVFLVFAYWCCPEQAEPSAAVPVFYAHELSVRENAVHGRKSATVIAKELVGVVSLVEGRTGHL